MKPWMNEILESHIRIISLQGAHHGLQLGWILEYFYNVGLRKGDIIFNIQADFTFFLTESDLDTNDPF